MRERSAPHAIRRTRIRRGQFERHRPRAGEDDFPISLARQILHSTRAMPPLVQTILLLIASNVFMTFAWYGHLRDLAAKPAWIAVLASWGIAFFEYLLQVPANRIGHAGGADISKLKILQEVITLGLFVPFSIYFMRQPVKLDFLWAALCMCGAVYFMFRN
jgi:hypothetical protein